MDVLVVTTPDGVARVALQLNAGGYAGANDGNFEMTLADGTVMHVGMSEVKLEVMDESAVPVAEVPVETLEVESANPIDGGPGTLPSDVTTTVDTGSGGTEPVVDAEA